ncbi:hypothetical protein GCM10010347_28090 [Streptomyces cirratus]|uniref:Uncharacterized protein n=1 Tax=Streptomyces cirratus TaxID=68187 RepID=A0ABQ3EZR7_9ACTN|nr:hypothetical protein GCM10010347_28090 [Streptomyces cirratus]
MEEGWAASGAGRGPGTRGVVEEGTVGFFVGAARGSAGLGGAAGWDGRGRRFGLGAREPRGRRTGPGGAAALAVRSRRNIVADADHRRGVSRVPRPPGASDSLAR